MLGDIPQTLEALAVVLSVMKINAIEDIRLPPYFTSEPPLFMYIKSGDNTQITLPCSAGGLPEPEYSWYKNGEHMSYTTYIYIQPRTGNLVFEVPTILDEGYYQCMAENQNGKVVSQKTKLTKIMLGQFSDISTITPKLVGVGEPIHLSCNPPRSVPAATFEWGLVREGSDPSSPNVITRDKRIQIDSEGNLLISNAHLQDSQSGYNYVCQARNNELLSSSGGSLHKVTVTGTTVSESSPRVMYQSSGPVVGLISTTEKLQCFFSGYPTPSVSWKKKNGNLPGGGRATRAEHDTQLEIRNIQFSDAGTYICTGSNSMGQQEAEIEFDVQSIPTFNTNREPMNMNISSDEEAVMRCEADGVPPPEVQWFMNGNPLNVDSPPDRMLVEMSTGTLNIRKVCKDCLSGARSTDLMVIQCNASNTNGYVFGQGYINVLNKTMITKRGPTSVIFAVNDSMLHLPCEGSTDDATDITLTWHKATNPIRSLGDEHLTEYSNGSLIIDLSGLTVEEREYYQVDYTCELSNGYSTDEAVTSVNIAGASKQVTISSASFPLWMIILIIAVALLMLIITLCCCICAKRGKQDIYDVDKNEKIMGAFLPEEDRQVNEFKEFQRPDCHAIKGSRASLASSVPLDSDDDGMTDMYGDPDLGRFGEDGSFIGQYSTMERNKIMRT